VRKMVKIKLASLLISLTYLAFFLYFLYKVLEHIKATELLWFLFWVIVPLAFVLATLEKLAEWEEE